MMTDPEDPERINETSALDVSKILKGFGVVAVDASDEVPADKSTADAFLAVVEDPANASLCIAQLFPSGIPLDQLFFDRLDEFRRWIGVAESGDEAIGIVWSEAMHQLSQDDQLMLAPEQQICPYCGTQQAKTVDHYFSQSVFLHLSIALKKLVASCSSSNHLKTSYVPTNPDDLLFHPYYEEFPNCPWLVAEADRSIPVTVVYSVADDAAEYARISRQFDELELAKNFASFASNEIRNRIYEFQRLFQRGPTFLRELLLEAAHSAARFKWYPWKPVLHNVLAEDEWFCNGGFIESSEDDET